MDEYKVIGCSVVKTDTGEVSYTMPTEYQAKFTVKLLNKYLLPEEQPDGTLIFVPR